jgi:hypothetical protein
MSRAAFPFLQYTIRNVPNDVTLRIDPIRRYLYLNSVMVNNAAFNVIIKAREDHKAEVCCGPMDISLDVYDNNSNIDYKDIVDIIETQFELN